MKLAYPALAVLGLSLLACAAPQTVQGGEVIGIGQHFDTPEGKVFALHVQDEYRVIRCTQEGPIKGCYEDVFSVSRGDFAFNRWMPVFKVPGLEFAVVGPEQVAFRMAVPGSTR